MSRLIMFSANLHCLLLWREVADIQTLLPEAQAAATLDCASKSDPQPGKLGNCFAPTTHR